MIPTQNLSRFILARERQASSATGELSELLTTIALGVKLISNLVATAGFKGLHGYSGQTNIHGENTQKLDVQSHEILAELLASSGHFGLLVSEEQDTIIPTGESGSRGKYVVAFDPLDGSSNLGFNISVGTIFSIFKRPSSSSKPCSADFYQPGRELVAAGYSVYGSSTVFVYSCGQGVHEFTLDPSIGEFVLTNPAITLPNKGTTYSINEGNSSKWDPKIKRYIERLKGDEKEIGAPYSARYIGSLVADFHRNLKKGGIFLYPADSKYKSGKLRLLYECIPIAFVAEAAGGSATDGTKAILDIIPNDIHQRSPLIVGSKSDVDMFMQMS